MLPTFIGTDLVNENIPVFSAALGGDFEPLIEQKQVRMGEVGDITPLAVFLAGDQSRFITGSEYVVDNGWTASLL
jgi:NAD(P)-dependent dehydrogenase (short-subunit alcohol dehydrogenase family)